MALQDRIQQELKAAMLAKDANTMGTLRLLKSAMGYAQIEKKTDALSDAEVVALIQKEIKKRRDAIELYQSGGRPELAAKSGAVRWMEEFKWRHARNRSSSGR